MGQANTGDIKIRTLPRKNEKPASEAQSKSTSKQTPETKYPRWIIYVGSVSALLVIGFLALPHGKKISTKAKPAPAPVAANVQVHSQDLSSFSVDQANDLVSKHMQESQMRHEMMVQKQMLENMKAQTTNLQTDDYAVDTSRSSGVHLEQQENTADRVFQDLNQSENNYVENNTPGDKINARLANRKFVNETERQERVTYVRNFIRSAYDQGYEVQIDQNLKVVGVKKITGVKKVSIDQAIDKLAAQQGF